MRKLSGNKKELLGVLIMMVSLSGCSCRNNKPDSSAPTVDDGLRPMQSHPYYAREERRSRILANLPLVKPELESQDVRKLLGEPDEINDTYEPQKHRPAKIGFSYVYVIQRLRPTGSMESMQEKFVRVHFDVAERVVRVDLVGLDPESDRERG